MYGFSISFHHKVHTQNSLIIVLPIYIIFLYNVYMLSFYSAQNYLHNLHPELSHPQNGNVCSGDIPDSIEGSRIDID